MTVDYKTAVGLKAQLSKFSGIISKGFGKPKRKLIKEMLYGIQASKDVKLSNISRTLKEEQSLIKTEDRLSRNLDDQDFTGDINEEMMRLAASEITEDMVVAVDPGDLRKKYAKKMEFLGKVRNGSENEIGEGYPLCKAVATDIESHKVIPIWNQYRGQSGTPLRLLGRNKQLMKYRWKSSVFEGGFYITRVDCVLNFWASEGAPVQCSFLFISR